MMHILIFAARAWGEDGHAAAGAHHATAIPWSSLLTQTFNFVFLFVLLGYVMRKSVSAHFATRAREYDNLVTRAEAARVEAERGKREIEQRLAALEGEAGDSEAKARAEAARLRTALNEEAREFSIKLEREATQAAALAVEKAKAELRRELLDHALTASGEQMRTGLSQTEQKKLQTEFVEKIQVVAQ